MVGIQFQKTVEVETVNPTIEDVMRAAGGGPEQFTYIKVPDRTLQAVSAHIPEGHSRSSGRKFAAGLYSLTDGAISDNMVSTWQWYLVRDGRQVNVPNAEIERFSDPLPPEYALADGDLIVWRLVIVLMGPTVPKSGSAFPAKLARHRRY